MVENKIDTGIELSENSKSVNPVMHHENPSTCLKIITNIRRYFTVEPFLIFYLVPIYLSSVAVQRLNMIKACRVDLNSTQKICEKIVFGGEEDNTTTDIKSEMIIMLTNVHSWQIPLQNSVPLLLILFLGAWSDKTGNRKILILMPIAGEIVSTFGLLWATYFFLEWPLWSVALIEVLPTALSGGNTVALMGAFSYLAECTTAESRTFKFGVVSVIVSLSSPIGSALSGILLVKLGFYGVFGITLALYLIGFIYTYKVIHDIRKDGNEGTFINKIVEFFHPKHVWNTIGLLFATPIKQRIKIILVICVYMVVQGPAIGESSVMDKYTTQRYNMTPVDFSLFSSYSSLMSITGAAVAVVLFSKWLKMHDSFLGIIAAVSKIVSSFVYGLAETRNWFYSGPAFDFFGNTAIIAVRSIATKVVDPDEVGKMNSLIGLTEALLPIICSPIYLQVFNNTIYTAPGAVFFVGGALTIPSLFIFMAMFIISKKEQKDAVQNPKNSETYAYDNTVSSL